MDARRWYALCKPRAESELRLLCLPYSGGGAIIFKGWAEALPEGVEVCPVELPGHGTRRSERPVSDLKVLIESMADGLAPLLGPPGPPFVIFGISMGGLVGFELARELRRRGKEPAALLVASQNAPRMVFRRNRSGTAPKRHLLSEEKFRTMLRRSGRIPKAVIDNSRLMRIFGPVMIADYTLVDAYKHEPEEPLGCPIHLFVGNEDSTLGEEDVSGWHAETLGSFAIHRFPGGHFFFENDRERLLKIISRVLYSDG